MKVLYALLLSIGVLLTACSESSPPPSPTVSVDQFSIEQKFVSAAAGVLVAANDPSVARAKTLIDRAAANHKISREFVGDQAYMAYKIANDDRIAVSAMEILEAATLAYVPGIKMDFAEYCATYLTLRKSGIPHAEAMLGMKGLITKIKEIGDSSTR